MNHIPVRTLDLSSAVLATHDDRVDGWHAVQAPLFHANLTEDRQGALDWRFQLNHLGVSMCGRTRSSDQTIRRTASAIAAGTCDHIFVDHLVDCEMAGEAGGKSFSATSGDLVLFDMARPAVFDIAAPNPAAAGWRTAFMMIPRATFETSCDVRNLHGMVLRKDSPAGRIVSAHVRALTTAAATMGSQEAEAMGRATAAFLAQALALSSYRDPRDEDVFADVALLRVRHFIMLHLERADLSPALIACECAVSRAALYRLFEPFGGVAHYVRRQRLLRAKRELSAPSMARQTISTIARRNGFIDDASFRRAFRQAFGISASDIRPRKQVESRSALLPGGDTIDAWIRDL